MTRYSSEDFNQGSVINIYTPITILKVLTDRVNKGKLLHANKELLYNFLMDIYEKGFREVEISYSNKIQLELMINKAMKHLKLSRRQIINNLFLYSKVTKRKGFDLQKLYKNGLNKNDVIYLTRGTV